MFYLFFATSGMGFIVGGRFVLSLPTFKTTKSDNFSQKLFFLDSYWGIFYLVATEEISTVHLKYKGITLNKD
jgi:hypothetical protein